MRLVLRLSSTLPGCEWLLGRWQELKETTIDASKRSLLQVTMEQASIADEVCSVLMGEDVEQRRHFIQTNAKDIRFLDI